MNWYFLSKDWAKMQNNVSGTFVGVFKAIRNNPKLQI